MYGYDCANTTQPTVRDSHNQNQMLTSSHKIPFVSRVAETLEEGGGEVEGGGMALAECCSHHGSNVDHGALRPHRQAAAHSCRTGHKLDQQCPDIEHLQCDGCQYSPVSGIQLKGFLQVA